MFAGQAVIGDEGRDARQRQHGIAGADREFAAVGKQHQRVERVRQLAPIAEELGCTLAQLALAWCLANPHVSTVITGASRPEQVTENMKALDVVPLLTPDVLARLDDVMGNKPA